MTPPAGRTLRESFWHPAAAADRTRSLLPWLDVPERYAHAYAAWLEPNGPVLVAAAGMAFSAPAAPLQEHLARHRFSGLWDAAYVVDAFRLGDPPCSAKARLDFDFAPVPLVDDVLKAWRGVLMWTHQLEHLYALFGHPAAACVAFRRDVNRKKARAFDRAAGLRFDGGVSLEEVIQDRMRFRTVTSPSLHAGRALSRFRGRS